jgi:hypothetical protein
MSYSNITPFAAAKIANIMLRQNDLDIEIRPQMMYNYAKKNIIASNYLTRDESEKIYFDGDSFKAWIDRYINAAKNGTVSSRADYESLAEEFSN